MSEKEADKSQHDPIVEPFVDLWASYTGQATDATKHMFGEQDGCLNPQAWHQQWLDALSKSVDAYMRTPVFLQLLKQNLDAMIQARLLAVAADPQETGQTTEPASQEMQELSQRVENAEQEMADRFQEIERRFFAIENELRMRDERDQAESAPRKRTTK